MSLKQLKVFIHELELGMFVSALDKPWAETPFPIQGFVVKTGADISRVKAYCDYVYVDVEKGVSPLDIEANPSSPSLGLKPDILQSKSDSAAASINASRSSKGSPRKSLVINPDTYKKTVELAREIPAARRAMNNLLGCLTVASRAMLREGAFDRTQLQHSVDEMVDSVIRCPDAFTWLLRLRSKDAHSHDHSVRSSLWATQFGRHIGLTVEQLKDLCLATMLKDVGRVKLDRALLHNRDRSAEQEAEYRSFVSHSVELLRASGVDNRQVLNIIVNVLMAAASPRAVLAIESRSWPQLRVYHRSSICFATLGRPAKLWRRPRPPAVFIKCAVRPLQKIWWLNLSSQLACILQARLWS